MKKGKKIKKPEKINLVPILDAVFIFIFFLLSAIQFVDIYEIGSSIPVAKEMVEDQKKDDPLNLTLIAQKESVVVEIGLKNKRSKTFRGPAFDGLKSYLMGLKKTHPKENTMIVKAVTSLGFQDLVNILDIAQPREDLEKGKLFEQLVFEGED